MVLSMMVSVCLWTGCTRSSLNSQQSTFLLEIPTNPAPLSVPAAGILKIRHCRVATPFDNPYFLYRTESGTYRQDYYKLFLTPASEQITEHLRTWLDQSRIFTSVLPASSAARSQYVIEPHLSAIYTDFTGPTGSAVIRLHAVLLKTDKDYLPSSIVLEKTYEQASPLPGNTGSSIINGYNLCLEQILTQLQSDIVTAIKKSVNE
jgi:uncharacterized lipoprotein YmbA